MEECPLGTYPEGSLCRACSKVCASCESKKVCLSCAAGFFRIEDRSSLSVQCVEKSGCPRGSYPDETAMSCTDCHETCLQCHGPTNKECTECDYTQGYTMANEGSGECLLKQCTEGMHLLINETEVVCLPCDSSCKSCASKGKCTECKGGFLSLPAANGTVLCERCPSGYAFSEAGTCKGKSLGEGLEICGDGLNLGNHECDDGNLDSGDGCDSKCKVEAGYECYRQASKIDICVDRSRLYATLKVEKENKLTVVFNKQSFSNVSSTPHSKMLGEELKKSMSVILIGGEVDPFEVPWEFESSFKALKLFKQFSIETEISFDLKGGVEKFYVKFGDKMLIQDLAGNALSTDSVDALALRKLYFSATEQAATETIGAGFQSSGLLTFAGLIALNLLQSVAMGSFWTFVDTIQFLSYLPLIDCFIPGNLEMVLSDYLTVGDIKIPFDMLPEWVPSPKKLLVVFELMPFNERIVTAGYESLSFIYNFAEDLVTWTLLGLFYILLNMLTRLFPGVKYLLSRNLGNSKR